MTHREELAARDAQIAALEDNLREHRDDVRRARETGQSIQSELSRRLQDAQAELGEKTRDVDLLRRFATVIDALPDPVVMIAMDGEVTYANPAATARAPRLPSCRGFGVLRFLTTESAALVRGEALPSVLDDGVWQQEVEWRGADGVDLPMHLTIVTQRDRYDYPEVFVAIARDVSHERHLRDALATREALHRAVIDSLAEGVLVEDRDGRVVAWNESALRILGLTDEQLVGAAARDAAWRITDDADESVPPEALPVSRAREGQRVDGALLRVHRPDGAARDLSMNARPMYTADFDDRPGGVTTFTDVTVQRAAERQLRFLTERDELTGLLNRRGFMESARLQLAACRDAGERGAMLYGDLDRFKSINDTFGHAAGDEALQEMSAALSRLFRRDDLVARLGGDEFTVFVRGAGPEEIGRMLERLEGALADANAARASSAAAPWVLAASFGAAYYDGGDTCVETLLKEADSAQYRIKASRKVARAA
jgi:diguanylate cyclase (GGDEF)-like protein/PAS domain S-box-containing protein